jgi:hypothetical protein
MIGYQNKSIGVADDDRNTFRYVSRIWNRVVIHTQQFNVAISLPHALFEYDR